MKLLQSFHLIMMHRSHPTRRQYKQTLIIVIIGQMFRDLNVNSLMLIRTKQNNRSHLKIKSNEQNS